MTDKQRAFLSWELGVFFHYGIRTFYEGHADWDGKPMPASAFLPAAQDCGQWLDTARAGGATYAILTAKHHDGFALWPSRHTGYSVAASPYDGDVVGEFVDACRARGVRVGLYYSPADKDMAARGAREHDAFFLGQISELLTGYGKIDYLWFDGCGSEGHVYDTARLVRAMRAMQPDMLLFNLWEPDTLWCGNEQGFAPDETDAPLPLECDMRIRRENWFYSDNDADTLKSVDELMGLYDYSVGRGANLLVNIAPDRRGLLPQADSARFIAFGEAVRARFSRPLAGAFAGDTFTLNGEGLCREAWLHGDCGAFTLYAAPACAPWMEVQIAQGAQVRFRRLVRFPAIRAQRLRVKYQGGALTGMTVY